MKRFLILMCVLALLVMCGCSKNENDPLYMDTITPQPNKTQSISEEDVPNSDEIYEIEAIINQPSDNIVGTEMDDVQLESVREYLMHIADIYSDYFIVEDYADEDEIIILFLQTNEEMKNESIEKILDFTFLAGLFTKETLVEELIGADADMYSTIVISVDSIWSISLLRNDSGPWYYKSILIIDELFEQDNPDSAKDIQELYYEKFKNFDLEMVF